MVKVFYIMVALAAFWSGEAGAATVWTGLQTEVQAPQGADRAAEILHALAAHVRALGCYEVSFAVDAGEGAVTGSYAVGGQSYYLRMGDAEIYSDGTVRWEVNNRTKEVSIDGVDDTSSTLLDNPPRAFELVDDAFTAELLGEWDGRAEVRLTPREASSVLSAVTVTVSIGRMEPVRLEYAFDGDRIRIDVLDLRSVPVAPPVFDRTAYPGYELIDFR